MASPHNIMSLVWRVAKENKTQETPNNNNKNNNNNVIIIIIKNN